MTIFLDLFILLLVAARLLVKTGMDLLEFLQPYQTVAGVAVVVLFVLKYAVYGIPTFQYVRSLGEDAKPLDYAILGVYPVCDLIRAFLVFGMVSGAVNRVFLETPVFNVYFDALIYLALVVMAFFIDYFLKDAETIWSNLIATTVFVVIVLVFSKSVVWTGLGLMFA